MKKLESSLVNMAVSLAAFAVVVGALLAWVNHVTAEPILAQERKALSDGLRLVMGGGEIAVTATDTLRKSVGGKEQDFVAYSIASPKGESLGTAVESSTVGFGGTLRLLVGFDATGKVLGYTVLQSSETPGLGAKADKWFQRGGKGSIIGMSPGDGKMAVKQDGGDVDAITASTITSRAFLKAVRQAYDAIRADGADGSTGASRQTDGETAASPQRAN